MTSTTNRSIQSTVGAIALSTIAVLSNQTKASAISLTYEAPNVFVANTSIIGSTAVNDFETGTTASSTPITNYTFDFVDATTNNNYRATYDNLVVTNYGNGTQTAGAGYTGKFATNSNNALTNPALPTTNLTFTNLTNGGSAGVKYFGLFFSSLDDGNQLTFYNGTTELGKLSISNFATLVGGNATPFIGGPYNQPGAFFNFYAGAGEQFTRIEFTQTDTNGGFENDNQTFRIPNALAISGTDVDLTGLTFTGNITPTAVPEPLTIIGTIIGGTAALRIRKKLKANSGV